MTTVAGHQIVPHHPADLPELAAADRGVASSLEAVLAGNTRRTYAAQWRLFDDWCDQVGLSALPADSLTVARYLAARAGSGASIATLRLATSAIAKAHEWAKLESPCRDPGVRASLKGWGRRLAKPQRQSGALPTLGHQCLCCPLPLRGNFGRSTPSGCSSHIPRRPILSMSRARGPFPSPFILGLTSSLRSLSGFRFGRALMQRLPVMHPTFGRLLTPGSGEGSWS